MDHPYPNNSQYFRTSWTAIVCSVFVHAHIFVVYSGIRAPFRLDKTLDKTLDKLVDNSRIE